MGWLTTIANNTPEAEIFVAIFKVFKTLFHQRVPPTIVNQDPITFTCCLFNLFYDLLLVAFIHTKIAAFHVHLLGTFLPLSAGVHVVLLSLHEEDWLLWG